MQQIQGLRSPHEKVGRLVYFGRMIDKIRLHAAGRLPFEFIANLGESSPRMLDARCCRFLGIAYNDLVARAIQGGTDEEILSWAHSRGLPRSDEDCSIWNAYMAKLGWRDEVRDRLSVRISEYGLENRGIETFFDLIDVDEGREPGRRAS
jgi:gluconokinase